MAKHTSVDALTRALCPSIDASVLAKPFSWPLASVPRRQFCTCIRRSRLDGNRSAGFTISGRGVGLAGRPPSTTCAASPRFLGPELAGPSFAQQTRAYRDPSKAAKLRKWLEGQEEKKEQKRDKGKKSSSSSSEGGEEGTASEQEKLKELYKTCIPWIKAVPGNLRVDTLYEALERLRLRAPEAAKVREVVSYLVRRRSRPPDMRLYETMVLVNLDTTTGSASELAGMYKEMRTEGIKPSPAWYHDALRLLAIHPDYLMRTTLLERMKEDGVELTKSGRWNVALGLLRDGQNEMALDCWADMVKDKIMIPPWLAQTFIFVMVLRGFLDEAVDLCAQALESKLIDRTAQFRPLWTYLLDEFSRAFHYQGTKYIWDEMVVQAKALGPSDGVVVNVLNTAARHGDPALATSAIELLASRDIKLGPHHYEPLLESYVHAGRLADAFRVLGIMRDAGLQPDRASTRAIYLALKEAPERVEEAVRVLGELGPVPPVSAAAVNVVLEAAAKASEGDMARTLDVYKRLCEGCGAVPNEHTFGLLLAECQGSEPAVFLLHEMDRYSVRPSHPILDNLIRCFAVDGNLSVALAYIDELGQLLSSSSSAADAGLWISQRTLKAVLRRCYDEKHPDMWKLLEEAKRRGMEVGDWAAEAA
ncbi:hypothetical protein VTJ83DRAFT_4899 [Remersonia thermophila]|uniref:Pentatricopeptide repeat-containing protein-mitochondrial domain-containing protein n=1 Tax=Remersonia thermophila TaxID=72144 RepID=A0ABR4DB96_9PEZI